MSDDEKLCKVGPDGYYCLCFRNRVGLSLQEIADIFSAYGDVVNVQGAARNALGKDRCGYHFVRYRTKEETMRCIEGLKSHSQITLAEAKYRHEVSGTDRNAETAQGYRSKQNTFDGMNKLQNNRGQNARDDGSRVDRSNSFKKNWEGEDRSNGNRMRSGQQNGKEDSTHNNVFNNFNRSVKGENKSSFADCDKFQRNGEQSNEKNRPYDNRLANKVNRSNEQQKRNVPRPTKTDDQNPNLNNRRSETDPFDKAVDEATAKLKELNLRRGLNADTFKPSFLANDNVPTVDFPRQHNFSAQLLPNLPVYVGPAMPVPTDTDDMPALVPPSPSSTKSSSRDRRIVADPLQQDVVTIMAQDVIVGNMHPNMGISYIQRLFRRYNPIHVSDVEIVPDMGVRFCHVYLRTPEDALDAEESYDCVNLFGDKLIVLRAKRLEELAGPV